MQKEMGKKGLSDVVTTVLIILFGIVAVAIIGAIVINQVRGAGSQVSSLSVCQTLDMQSVSCMKSGTQARLIVKRGNDVAGYKLINLQAVGFESSGASTLGAEDTGASLPGVLGTKGLTNLSGKDFAEASVIATLQSTDGKNIKCDYSEISKVKCTAA